MDEALYFILHGCHLAKKLESNLQNSSNQPDELSTSCQKIIGVFTKAMNCLNSRNPAPNLVSVATVIQLPEARDPCAVPKHELTGATGHVMTAHDLDVFEQLKGYNATLEDIIAGASNSSRTGFLKMQGSKKRRGSSEKSTIKVPATPVGNVEVIPDDGFSWRKYGQQEILGTRFPRNYYRCTHKAFYGCDAKKQVQRSGEDPNTYEITYCSHHTCHTPKELPINPVNTMESEMPESSPRRMFAVGPHVPKSNEHVQCMEDQLLEYAVAMFNLAARAPSSHQRWEKKEGGQTNPIIVQYKDSN